MSILASVVALLLAAAEPPADAPPSPKNRRPPDYPAACMPAPGATQAPQSVTVAFTVNRDGLPENVRVQETSDPCFNEAAIAAVRGWSYDPARVEGARKPQELEVTFTFVLAEPTEVLEFDATPIFRMPPQYPERCFRRAEPSESVLVEFDVTVEGATDNIRIVESTNNCFDQSSIAAVTKWKYRPKIVGGDPMVRRGVQTTITYQQGDDIPPAAEMRRYVVSALLRAQRLSKKDPEKALAELAEIEEKYGSSFTAAETSVFHQVRAQARIAAKDYRGALDDLRVVQRMGRTGAGEAVAEVIAQLEAFIAAEEAKAAAEAAQPESAQETNPQ